MFEHTQGNGAGVRDLSAVVTGVGANLDAFRECLAVGKMDEKVQENIQQAKGLGISGTPATSSWTTKRVRASSWVALSRLRPSWRP